MKSFYSTKKLYPILIVFGLLLNCQIYVYAIDNKKSSSVLNVKRNGIYELKYAGLSMKIDANCGARIRSFILNKQELLTSDNVNPENFGSTLWLSPQTWKWPPSVILDRGIYTVSKSGKKLVFESQIDTVSGFIFKKTFYVEESDTAMVIQYQITNESNKELKVAPWEVTRLFPGGISFFPKGLASGYMKSNLATKEIDGIVWFDYNSNEVTNHQKLFMDGSEGWCAHIKDELLFIKQFEDIKPEHQAPRESEIEIFVNKDKSYIELENQGKYQVLKPSESLKWEMKWYLRDVNKLNGLNGISPSTLSIVRQILNQ